MKASRHGLLAISIIETIYKQLEVQILKREEGFAAAENKNLRGVMNYPDRANASDHELPDC